MYRDLGDRGVVFGLRQGPYAGGPRTFRRGEVPVAVLARLRCAVAGQGRPEPLLRVSRRPDCVAWAALGLTVPVLVALGVVAAAGFGSDSGLPQGLPWAGVYATAVAAVAIATGFGWRTHPWRWVSSGVYLLPCDVVEVSPDAVTVYPLGGVRQVAIEGQGALSALTLRFEHGARFAFPVGSEREAEGAYERLAQTQELLETLTATTDLERALDLDPFFTLRGSGPGPGGWERTARSPLRSALGWGLLALGGAAAGVGLWMFLNAARDQASFDRADSAGTVEAYQRYLAAGRLRRAQAISALGRVRDRAALDEANRRFHEEEARPAPAPDPCRPPRPELASREVMACYRPHATGVRPAVQELLDRRLRGPRQLTVAWRHRLDGRAAPAAPCGVDCRHETITLEALRQAFGEVFPPAMLALTEVRSGQPDLLIDVHHTGSSDLGVYTFDVTLPTSVPPTTFQLTMPAPPGPLDSVRTRSLFVLSAADSASRAAEALSARAYDRLYDELFGLFFAGDPLVPLR